MELLIILIFLIGTIIYVLYIGVNMVPQGEEWVVERVGKFNRTLKPGLNIITPFLDKIRIKIDTRDLILDVERQEVITADNAIILANAIAFVRVTNPEEAIYGIEDYMEAIKQLIQTSLRAIIGEFTLEEALTHRDEIKEKLKDQISDVIIDWGITVKSVEIQDIIPNPTMQESMEKQAAATREKKAMETLAEGKKNAYILEAQGKLEASKLEAQAQIALANASAEAIGAISDKIKDGQELPAMFLLGDRYIDALEHVSVSDNAKIIVYPADLQGAVKGMLGNVFK